MRSSAKEFTVCFLATLCVFSFSLNVILATQLYRPTFWRDIRLSVKAPPPVSPADHIRGAAQPSVTIIDYSDYQCPYSKKLHLALAKLVEASSGTKIQWVFRNRPLDSIHPFATKAATAAECAGKQGQFWNYSDLLFQNQEKLPAESTFIDLATRLKLDLAQFNTCRALGSSELMKSQISAAYVLEITSTPTFFINGKRYTGVIPETQLTALLR